jgi:cyclopropane fatty-acyl-phospholipid synthase-like methyltransferase
MRSVSPKVYTKDYYLTDCTGYSEFSSTYGKALEPRLARIAPLIPSVRNKRILDIGCGRGEMVLWAAERGSQAYGIDYSKDAILLSKKALSKRKRSIKGNGKATFQLANGKELPYKDSFFDMVFLFEVLEHLYPEEQDALFDELQRVVKPNGVVLIHTAPSRTFQDFTYKLWCYPISSILVFLSNFTTGNARDQRISNGSV